MLLCGGALLASDWALLDNVQHFLLNSWSHEVIGGAVGEVYYSR